MLRSRGVNRVALVDARGLTALRDKVKFDCACTKAGSAGLTSVFPKNRAKPRYKEGRKRFDLWSEVADGPTNSHEANYLQCHLSYVRLQIPRSK